MKLADKIKSISTVTSGQGLYHHNGTLPNGINDDSYRYAGANPDNYVKFAGDTTNTLYRIIGVFGDKVKLIRNESIGDKQWDTARVNNWADTNGLKASLAVELNNQYYNGLPNKVKNCIENATWKIAGVAGDAFNNMTNQTPAVAYQNEVVNPYADYTPQTTEAKIGLMYVSDYGFSATPDNWTLTMSSYNYATTNNWLFNSAGQWTITRQADNTYNGFRIDSTGNLYIVSVNNIAIVRPVFYLTPQTEYKSGIGTLDNPYIVGRKPSYVVTFNTDGGTPIPPQQSILEGNLVEIPTSPTRQYYVFDYWEKNGVQYNFATPVNDSFTLTAHWTRNSHTISFDSSNGTPTPPQQNVLEGNVVEIPTPEPTKTGNIFKFWSQNGTDEYDFNTPVTSNFTLIAIWQPITYTIQFNANSGTGTMPTMSLEYDESKMLLANTFTKNGYSFEKWNTEPSGNGIDYNNEATVQNLTTVDGEIITLYAIWGIIKYTVTFNANGGSPTPQNQVIDYGNLVIEPPNPTKQYHTFDYWEKDGVEYDFTSPVDNDFTLVAHWTRPSYVVTFNSNGGTPTPSSQTILSGNQATPPSQNPAKEQYIFKCWSLDGTNAYNFSTPITNNITLVALWEEKWNGDTLYLDTANPYISSQEQIDTIYEKVNNFEISSMKTGRIYGNPAIDSYDLIEIVDDYQPTSPVIAKTLATYDLIYNGVITTTYNTTIEKGDIKENITLRETPQTVKKYAKTEIDNVEGAIRMEVGQVSNVVESNYVEISNKFNDYALATDYATLEHSVNQLQTDTYTKTEINTKLTDGSVTKVQTMSGTFDENGMHYEKTNAPTSSTINESGMAVNDASSNEELLFAGYDSTLRQSIVRTENLTVRKYLVIDSHTRIEEYDNGGGLFIL